MPQEPIMSLSGTRAIVGENLNPTLATEISMAFGSYLGKGKIIVGGDTRVSHEMVKHAVLSGLLAVGNDVIYIGKVTTPTVQQMIKHHEAVGGIVITASHNPIQWNGLKLMNRSGSFLDTKEYETFINKYHEKNFDLKPWDQLGTITEDNNAIQKHVDLILEKLDISSIKGANLNVLVDAVNGAGAVADPVLLDALGVNYTIINEAPDGRFGHDPEPVKGNLIDFQEALAKGNYDIGFAQDADADRLVILDENGRFIGEDYSLAYCVDYILSQDTSEAKKVVVNLSTSLVLTDIAKKHNADIFFTKIGEANVTEGLKAHQAQVGGEGNGGIIFTKIGWGRDSLVGITVALKHIAESKKKVSEVIETYPQYTMIRDKFEVSTREEVNNFLTKVDAHFEHYEKDKQDGIKVLMENSWIHVRPSNTEPIVRIFIEAPSQEKAEELLSQVKEI